MNDFLPCILLVDDDISVIQSLRKVLRGLGILQFATSGEEALRMMQEKKPDLLILDAEMPGMSGFQVVQAMRSLPDLVDILVMFVTKHNDAEFECAALELGAVDFVSKPINPMVMSLRIKTQLRLLKANELLRQQATIDKLTGILNRRSFDTAMDREWRRSLRSRHAISVLMIDVDYFKKYNDTLGHAQGDDCLASVAQTLKRCLHRPADIVARYGGEEFAVILPETNAKGALKVAYHIVECIKRIAIPHPASDVSPYVTVSIGVSSLDEQSLTWNLCGSVSRFMGDESRALPTDLIKAADVALYAAKQSGRSQACFRPIDALLETRIAAESLLG